MSVSLTSNPLEGRMIRLHRSARMETLLEALVSLLATPPGDLTESLRGEVIAVPNRGMERWLSMSLAERLGICAGVDMPFPRRMLQRALREILGEEGCPHPGWEPNALAFHVLTSLDPLLEQPAFAPISGYLEATEASEEVIDRRRILLARRIAVTFDRYITQRPEMARDWSAGRLGEDPDWQPILWSAIQESIGGPHLATCALELHRSASLDRPQDRTLPSRLHVFGVTSLPPLFLELLRSLTCWWDVHLHVLAPSEVYWAGLQTRLEDLQEVRRQITDTSFDASLMEGMENPFKIPGNALLESYGALSRDMQLMLEGPSAETPYLEAMNASEIAEPTTILGTLQHDIHQYIDRTPEGGGGAEPPVLVDDFDRSVQVHGCHGPTRQVEVLRDVLMGLLNDDSSLEPRDIVVMTPDIETYSPLIEAVFSDGDESSAGEAGFPKLPFTIADRSMAQENRSAEAVLALVALASGSLKASHVLDFLSLDPVRRRFDLDDVADELIRTWVKESGIRWGLDAAHRVKRDQPEENAFTWRFGLDRLLLGVAMDEGAKRSFCGVVPWDSAAVGDREVLGRFIAFMEALELTLTEFAQPHDAIGWRAVIVRAMGRLFVADDDSVHAQQQVRTALDELVEHAGAVQLDSPLSLDALECIVRERIELQGGPSGFLGGRITCCAMVPMRSIPFRVVCLLGMDDGAFPRQGGRLGFDQVAQAPRLGDTDPRREDRHLFLEALLSARDQLVITYTGRSRKDNKSREPAVPVCDLLDVLERSVRLRSDPGTSIRAHLVKSHPLHAFSELNYRSPAFSFDRRGVVGARTLRSPRVAEPVFFPGPLPVREPVANGEVPTLELEAFVSFLSDPTRMLVQQRLEASLHVKIEERTDREPLELNGLENWKLGKRLLDEECEDPGAFREQLRGEAILPVGGMGASVFSEAHAATEGMHADMRELGGGEAETLEVDCPVGAVRIVGEVPGVRPKALVQARFGSVRSKDRFRLWVHLAVLTAMDPEWGEEGFFVGRPDKKTGKRSSVHMCIPGGDPEARRAHAREALEKMMELYLAGQTSPLPLFLDSARAYFQVLSNHAEDLDSPSEGVRSQALKSAQAGLSGQRDEEAGAHVERVFGRSLQLRSDLRGPGAGPDAPTFHEAACAIWTPIEEATG